MTVDSLLESVVLALALSMDTFVASFAYGSSRTQIPMKSVQTINAVCCSFLALALLLGTALKQVIPAAATSGICFTVLLLLGLVKLLDSVIKSLIRKYNGFNKEIKFSMLNLKFILNLYANPEDADVDDSKVISPAEAASLAVALSLDGLVVGMGAALGHINGWVVLGCAFVANTLAIVLGCAVGRRVAHAIKFDLSWLSGAFLLVLAVMKL